MMVSVPQLVAALGDLREPRHINQTERIDVINRDMRNPSSNVVDAYTNMVIGSIEVVACPNRTLRGNSLEWRINVKGLTDYILTEEEHDKL